MKDDSEIQAAGKAGRSAFDRIKEILDNGLDAWETANGAADLTSHSPTFGKSSWATKAALLSAVGHGRQLIQPEMIGNAQGAQTNLVLDLRTGISSPALRMPRGGPFIPDAQVQEIEDWINAGCPD